MNKKQEILLENIIQYYVEYGNLTEEEANEIVSLKKDLKAITVTRCCTELQAIEELKDFAYNNCQLHNTDQLDEIIERL